MIPALRLRAQLGLMFFASACHESTALNTIDAGIVDAANDVPDVFHPGSNCSAPASTAACRGKRRSSLKSNVRATPAFAQKISPQHVTAWP